MKSCSLVTKILTAAALKIILKDSSSVLFNVLNKP